MDKAQTQFPSCRDHRAQAARAGAAAGRAKKIRGNIGPHPSTGQPDYSPDELEFLMALDRYQCEKHIKFPTACDYLRVLRSLGYRKQPQ